MEIQIMKVKDIHLTSRRHYINSNNLWIRTVDTGSKCRRAEIYLINESFNADGILVTKAKYRIHPIQIFIEPILSKYEQII
jgi:hypothetical protein